MLYNKIPPVFVEINSFELFLPYLKIRDFWKFSKSAISIWFDFDNFKLPTFIIFEISDFWQFWKSAIVDYFQNRPFSKVFRQFCYGGFWQFWNRLFLTNKNCDKNFGKILNTAKAHWSNCNQKRLFSKAKFWLWFAISKKVHLNQLLLGKKTEMYLHRIPRFIFRQIAASFKYSQSKCPMQACTNA